MEELSELSTNQLADRIRLTVRGAKVQRGKYRSATAALGLKYVERLKVVSEAYRYETVGFLFRRTTAEWNNLVTLERTLQELKTLGDREQNGT